MARRQRWFWIVLFIAGILLITGLATGWNVVLVQDYYKILRLARGSLQEAEARLHSPWTGIVLGSLGFAATLAALVLFFTRLLKEMKLTQTQSEFLAQVSHALKTPIATIELSSSLLRQGDNSPEQTRKLWESHTSELRRLKEQVDQLLEAARVQTTHIKPNREFITLETWISEVMPRLREILGPGAELVREGPPLKIEAHLDTKLMALILENLVDNARKFAQGTPRVTIKTNQRQKLWRIAVIDQGWGFAPEDSEKIFNRFFRAKTEAPYAIAGTGLGLFLASTAARAQGLTLTAHSRGKGLGASFQIEGLIV